MTTPQPLAQEVAARAATMAQKTGMRLLGVVENMTLRCVRHRRRRAARGRARRSAARARPARRTRCARRATTACRSSSATRTASRRRRSSRSPRHDRREPHGRLHAHAAARLVTSSGRGILRPRPHADPAFVGARARAVVSAARGDLAPRPGARPRSGRCSSPPAARAPSGSRRGRGRDARAGGLPVAELRRSSTMRWSLCCDRSSTPSRSGSREQHRERGEPAFIVSATLQEIVERLAHDLGFDGAIGSTCEIVDGVYTGRSLRAAHGEAKAEAIRELAAARGFDLAVVDRVLRLRERCAVPGSGRSSGRREPGPAAPPDRPGAWLAGARLPRAVRAAA